MASSQYKINAQATMHLALHALHYGILYTQGTSMVPVLGISRELGDLGRLAVKSSLVDDSLVNIEAQSATTGTSSMAHRITGRALIKNDLWGKLDISGRPIMVAQRATSVMQCNTSTFRVESFR